MQVVSSQSFSAFGGGVAESAAHPLALGVLAAAGILILTLPRKHVIAPFLLAVFLVPMGNVVVVGGVHVTPVRILVLAGWVRAALTVLSGRTSLLSSGWNTIDAAVLCLASSKTLAFLLLWREVPALINQFGVLWSTLGVYFLLRFLIRSDEDILRTVKLFVLIAVANGASMAYEHFTRHDLFGVILGGVTPLSDVRDGKIRSQGAFAMSILAGTFAATLIPLMFWLWKSGRAKGSAAAGCVFTSVMVATTGSSTPLLGYLAAIVGLCFWPLRAKMRMVRRAIVVALVCLQLAMKSPIWFLLNHVNVIGASSGYGRSLLIDTCVRHFGDWWLLGIKSTASWGWDMEDLCDQYVAEAATGGLIAFIFFIVMIKRAFGALGAARKTIAGDRRQEALLWSLGGTLFAYLVAFFGISLWDQTQVAWLSLFAMVGAASFTRIAQQNTVERAAASGDSPAADCAPEAIDLQHSISA
jgi:hypothetical protein